MGKNIIIYNPEDNTEDTDFKRRRDIDRMAAKGLNAAEIAGELGLDVSFVGSVILGG